MKELIHFLFENKEWLFSGIGIAIVGILINFISMTIRKIEKKKSHIYISWIRQNSQWLLSGIGGFFIALIIGLASNIYVDKINQKALSQETINEQIQSLNNLEKSLNGLIVFVNSQKDKLRETENILSSLKKEHATLKPIVETEREAVEKIFALQSRLSRDAIWKERVISFFLGILASVIASFVYALFQRFYKKT